MKGAIAGKNNLIPTDWEHLCKTVLEGPQYLQFKGWWLEAARDQSRRNATQNPPGPTEEELTGSGGYATLQGQAGLSDLALTQLKVIVVKARMKIEGTNCFFICQNYSGPY